MIKKIIDFIKNGVWETNEEDVKNKKWRWLLRPFKIMVFTTKSMGSHNIAINASALSYYTLTALVPIAAIVFGIMKGFGLYDNLIQYIYDNIPNNAAFVEEFINIVVNKLNQTRGGILASAGFIFLLWSVIMVFSNVERVFNNIWEIKKQRPFSRKFTDYVAVIFVTPLLWVISNSMIVYIRSRVADFTGTWISDVLFSLISIVAIWMMFTFIYIVLPNTKVKLKGAFIAGVLAGTAFMIFQWAYVWLQGFMTSYNAIYGTLAAIPLFFIWLRISWQILLFGAELSFAYQNVDKFEMEREAEKMSNNEKRKVLLATMLVIIRHFVEGKEPLDPETISNELNMPFRIVNDVIFDLENAGMIAAVKYDTDDKVSSYIPARDINTITAADIMECVDNHPHSNLDFSLNPDMKIIQTAMEEFKPAITGSTLRKPLIQLLADEAKGMDGKTVNNCDDSCACQTRKKKKKR